MKTNELNSIINDGGLNTELSALYGTDSDILYNQRNRYTSAIARFREIFPSRDDVHIFSAQGRSEIGGNHTDHRRGCALGAAINLDTVAAVAFHDEGKIRLYSEGYGMSEVDLSDLSVHEAEKGSSVAMVRGIAARFAELGVSIGGFDAYSVSDVLSGSGLSSSAAFETLVGTVR